jgi:hypothetical protein
MCLSGDNAGGHSCGHAIVLVDYLQQLREGGMERDAAIVEAGRVRLRPILMTAFATILAMLPLALGWAKAGSGSAAGDSYHWRSAGLHVCYPGPGTGGLQHLR